LLFSVLYKASDVSNIFGYYCEYCLSVMKIFSFVLRYLLSGACLLSLLYLSPCLFTLGVLGPWEFSGGPGHVLSVRMWLRCVECRAGTILFRHSAGADGGTVQIFLSL
jgi:hypothetical protein